MRKILIILTILAVIWILAMFAMAVDARNIGFRTTTECKRLNLPEMTCGYQFQTIMSVGAKQGEVVELQRFLGGLIADGHYGNLTKNALIAYQTANNLSLSGNFDEATRIHVNGTQAREWSGQYDSKGIKIYDQDVLTVAGFPEMQVFYNDTIGKTGIGWFLRELPDKGVYYYLSTDTYAKLLAKSTVK